MTTTTNNRSETMYTIGRVLAYVDKAINPMALYQYAKSEIALRNYMMRIDLLLRRKLNPTEYNEMKSLLNSIATGWGIATAEDQTSMTVGYHHEIAKIRK